MNCEKVDAMTPPDAPLSPRSSAINEPPADKAAIDAATARSRSIATNLGALVSIMMRSPEFRNHTLSELEVLVGPALAANHVAIVEARDPKTGIVAPVAAALWAMVSADVDQRLSDVSIDKPRLEPKEWRSGPIPWIITAVGDQRALAALMEQLVSSRFPATPPKIRVRDKEGRAQVGHVSRSTPTGAAQPL